MTIYCVNLTSAGLPEALVDTQPHRRDLRRVVGTDVLECAEEESVRPDVCAQSIPSWLVSFHTEAKDGVRIALT